MFGPWDETPQHEMDSAMSAYGPQLGQDQQDYEYGLQQQMQLQRDMEMDEALGRGPFASAVYDAPSYSDEVSPGAAPVHDGWADHRDFDLYRRADEHLAVLAQQAMVRKEAEAKAREEAAEAAQREREIKHQEAVARARRKGGRRAPPRSTTGEGRAAARRAAMAQRQGRRRQPVVPAEAMQVIEETQPSGESPGLTVATFSRWILYALGAMVVLGILSKLF